MPAANEVPFAGFPAGYERLPQGVRCRCLRMYLAPDGFAWCKRCETEPTHPVQSSAKTHAEAAYAKLDVLIADLIDLEHAPHIPSRELLARTINTLADYRVALTKQKE